MDKNGRYFIYDSMITTAVYFTCGGAFITSLTGYFSLPLWLSNFIVALPTVLTLAQVAGGFAYERAAHKHRTLLTFNLLWRLFLPAVFFTALFHNWVGALLVVAFFFTGIAMYQFIQPAHTAWLVDVTDNHVEHNYYSVRDFRSMVFFTAVNFALGFVLDAAARSKQQLAGYIVIGSVQVVLVIISVCFLRKISPPAEDGPKAVGSGVKERFSDSMMLPLRDKNYLKVVLFNMTWNGSLMFVTTFSTVYQVRVLELSYATIIAWGTVANVFRIISIPLFAKLAVRIGWKKTCCGAVLLMAAGAAMWFCITPGNVPWLFPLVMIVAALPFGALNVGFFKLQVASIRPDKKSLYFSINAAMSGAAALVGTFLCSALVGVLEDIPPMPIGDGFPMMKLVFLVGMTGILCTVWLVSRTKEAK